MKRAEKKFINKIIILGLIIALIASIYPVTADVQPSKLITTYVTTESTIQLTLNFGNYQHTITPQGDEITLNDFGKLLIPGKPDVPARIYSIAIPPCAIVENVVIEPTTIITLPGTYSIQPVQLPRVIGEEKEALYQQDLQQYQTNYQNVYTTDTPYPETIGEVISSAYYRKYEMIDIRFTPIHFQPLSGKVIYYPEVSITITHTMPSGYQSDNIIVDNQPRTEQFAQQHIINYEQAQEWYPTSPKGRGSHDFVIITLDSLTTAVQPLKNWEVNKGRTVEVVTTSWINTNYNGYDLAEKMRNFLREKYPSNQWGVEDVLLVGHYDDVPMRRTEQNQGYGKPETDFYFAELSKPDDQSWDADGDHKYGENSDPIDFYGEVNVGRIPWSDPTIVNDICQKSVAYEQNTNPAFKKNILLIGAFFWPDTDNAVLMEYKTNPVNNPWMADWTRTRLYEDAQSSFPCDYDITYNNVLTVWSAGSYAFVNWAGHGSPTACYEYYPSQPFVDTATCNSLNDNFPAIIFADACSNSDTDELNIGQAMLKQGGIGFLGSTKVAYGMPGWSSAYSGSSQSLDYFFTSRVTSGDYTQGAAHQWSLTEMYTHNLWYYNKYETFEWGALWGNPNLGMITSPVNNDPPNTPTKPLGPEMGLPDELYTYSTSTYDPNGDMLYYCFDWDDGTPEQWMGPYESNVTISLSHKWQEIGNYTVQVKAKDMLGAESNWSQPITVQIELLPVIQIDSIQGFFGITATIKNVGLADATNLNWRIDIAADILFLGSETTGTITVLSANTQETIASSFVFGLGNAQIIVTVGEAEKSVTAFILGPFVFII